jgi:hypothetical protein
VGIKKFVSNNFRASTVVRGNIYSKTTCSFCDHDSNSALVQIGKRSKCIESSFTTFPFVIMTAMPVQICKRATIHLQMNDYSNEWLFAKSKTEAHIPKKATSS